MKRPNIVEFNLLDFNKDMDVAWQHIQNIYFIYLMNDPYWHFFYEREYSIIRCSKRYRMSVKKYLDKNNIQYNYVDKWKDGSVHVERYKTEFISLFHCFSMLAIQMPEEDFWSVSDRVVHCFYNHCTYMAKKDREKYGEMWEPVLAGLINNYRASYIGRCEGIKDLNNYYASVCDNAKKSESISIKVKKPKKERTKKVFKINNK